MKVRGRTHHMLLSLWGSRWREVMMSFFTVYLDDSGTSPSQKVANATALIVPASRILLMEQEWKNLKSKEQFKDFHTSIFVARNHKSEFANWSDEKQKRVFERVRQVTKKFGVKVWSFTLDKDDYDATIPSHSRQYAGTYHYTWAIRHVMTFLDAWRIAHRAQPLTYLFDWAERNDPCRLEIEAVMDKAELKAREKYGIAGRYTKYNFEPRQDHAGLQCVDCLAWTCYQYGLLEFRKKPVHLFAEIAWNDFARYRNGQGRPDDWFTALTLKKASLQRWVENDLPLLAS